MERLENKMKELASLLRNDDDFTVAEGIRQLREERPFEGAVGLLVSYYDSGCGKESAKAIEGFLNDLHELSLRPEVIGEIMKTLKPATAAMLVSSCWQSGLDYSAYAHDLAAVFVRSDYLVAVECLTVIESSVPELSRGKKDEIIKYLKDNQAAQDKRDLTMELISVLEK